MNAILLHLLWETTGGIRLVRAETIMLRLGIPWPICATLETAGLRWINRSLTRDGVKLHVAVDGTRPDGPLIGPRNIGSLSATNGPVPTSVRRVTIKVGQSRGSKCHSRP